MYEKGVGGGGGGFGGACKQIKMFLMYSFVLWTHLFTFKTWEINLWSCIVATKIFFDITNIFEYIRPHHWCKLPPTSLLYISCDYTWEFLLTGLASLVYSTLLFLPSDLIQSVCQNSYIYLHFQFSSHNQGNGNEQFEGLIAENIAVGAKMDLDCSMWIVIQELEGGVVMLWQNDCSGEKTCWVVSLKGNLFYNGDSIMNTLWTILGVYHCRIST